MHACHALWLSRIADLAAGQLMGTVLLAEFRARKLVTAHHSSANLMQDARSHASTVPHHDHARGGPAPDPSLEAPMLARLLPQLSHGQH